MELETSCASFYRIQIWRKMEFRDKIDFASVSAMQQIATWWIAEAHRRRPQGLLRASWFVHE